MFTQVDSVTIVITLLFGVFMSEIVIKAKWPMRITINTRMVIVVIFFMTAFYIRVYYNEQFNFTPQLHPFLYGTILWFCIGIPIMFAHIRTGVKYGEDCTEGHSKEASNLPPNLDISPYIDGQTILSWVNKDNIEALSELLRQANRLFEASPVVENKVQTELDTRRNGKE